MKKDKRADWQGKWDKIKTWPERIYYLNVYWPDLVQHFRVEGEWLAEVNRDLIAIRDRVERERREEEELDEEDLLRADAGLENPRSWPTRGGKIEW